MRRIIFLSLVVIQAWKVSGQDDPNAIITRSKAVEDLHILKTSLYEIHPSVFRYTPHREFDSLFKVAEEQIPDSIRLDKFAGLVSPLIASVKCGHTFPIMPFIGADTRAIPVDVKIIDDKIYIVENLSQRPQPAPGSEIISINSTGSGQILATLRKMEGADGIGTTTKDRRIERSFKWQYAMYLGQPDSFNIVISISSRRMPETTCVLLPSMTNKEMYSFIMNAKVRPYQLTVDKERNIAELRINTFMAKLIQKHTGENLKKFIQKSFKEIMHDSIGNLIIDIRDNTGGMAYVPPYLFSFIARDDFRFKEKLIFRHGYRFSHPEYLNRSKMNDWFNRKLMKKINDTTFEWTLHNNTKKLYRAQKNAFKGNVYVLINGMTASGAAEFASLVHHHKRGVFIGEESGGDYNGINGYDRTYLQLPNSKIGVLIAGYRSLMPWDEKQYYGHGVPVDYHVQCDIASILEGRDLVMEYALALIKK